MNNRQRLMWQLIDMSDEVFQRFVDCGCVYYKKDTEYCPRGCQQKCVEGQLKWLQQEYEGGDSQ